MNKRKNTDKMNLVLDNNILFSLMNPRSVSSYLFGSIDARYFAPDFILLELEKYHDICLSKSGLSRKEFEKRLSKIKNSINLIKNEDYMKHLKESIQNLTDPKDSPYLALAIYLNSPIWSNDKHLKKQNIVQTFTTSELLDYLE